MLAFLDLGAPLAPVAFATDAMGANEYDAGGYAVVAATIDDSLMRDWWRAGTQPNKTVAKLNGDISNLLKPISKLEARVPMSRLPVQNFLTPK